MANCTVSGTFTNPQGSAVSGATVRFNTQKALLDGSGNLIMPKEITTTTATDGTWSLSIIQGIAGNLTLDLNPTTSAPVVRYNFSLVTPSTTTATFASCWVDSGTFGGQGTSSPLTFSQISGTLATAQLPGLSSTDVWVGSSGGLATSVALSGDVALSNTGVTTVNTVGASTAANIHSAELLANAATSANTASTLVKRDASGNFTAGTITAALSGNATTATTAGSLSGSFTGDVTGTQAATRVVALQGYNLASTTPSNAQSLVYNSSQSRYNPVSYSGDVSVDNAGVTAVAKINGTSVSGTTGSGNVVFATSPTLSNPIVGTQTQGDGSTKAASTSYVDVAIANAIAGVNPAVAVQAATTSASDTSGFTYNNGASGIGAFFTGSVNTAVTVDGYTFTALGQRLLVKNDTQSPSGAFNGVYYVTQVQTAILPPIFTRALDYDMPSDMNNTGAIPVINGTVNGTTSWVLTSLVVTVGTTPLTFVKFTRNPSDYLLVSNNLSDVGTKATAFNNVSPITSTGDLIVGNGSNSNTRLAVGTQYQVAQATATTVAYDAVHLDQAAAVTGILPNANTTAVSTNTASKIVTRDASGNFSAGTITATLSGNATNVTGTVAVANGGTGAATLTSHGVVVGNGTSAVNVTTAGTSGYVLTSNGASADPTFQAISAGTPSYIGATVHLASNSAPGTNTILKFDTVDNQNASAYSTATGLYTVATAGYYLITFTCRLTSSAMTPYLGKNGSNDRAMLAATTNTASSATVIKLAVNDTVGIYANSTPTFEGASPPTTYASFQFLGT